MDVDAMSEEELDRIKARFERLARKARADTGPGQTVSPLEEIRLDPAVIPAG